MPLFSMTNLGKDLGLPTYDRKSTGRIWAFKKNTTSGLWEIYYSDNYTRTWFFWAAPSVQPNDTTGPYIHKDNQGNLYFQSGQGFYRVDASTKATSKVIDFYNPPGNTTNTYPWSFTEDNDGYIFVGQYSMANNGGQAIWKSTPGGTAFTRIDHLITMFPNGRHIHSIHANPYNGKLYIQMGDTDRAFVVSSDKLVTQPTVIGTANQPNVGNTGLTFTSEAVYSGQDSPGADNFIWRSSDDVEYVQAYTPPSQLIKSPMYYTTAVGDNEIWISIVDDQSAPNYNTGVTRLTKQPGLASPWTTDVLTYDEGPEYNRMNWYAIASNGQGVIPSHAPYVFIERREWLTAPTPNIRGIYMIQRIDGSPDVKIRDAGIVNEVLAVYPLQQLADNQIRTYVDGQVGCYKLVDPTDVNASRIKIYTKGSIKALEKQ